MKNKKSLKRRLKNFSEAYLELIMDEDFEEVCNSETNLPFYPFHLSMDELTIPQWCAKLSMGLEEDGDNVCIR